MKVSISTLLVVASKVQANLDREQFINAVRAYYGRNKESETVSSSAKVSKDGDDTYSGQLSVKVKKVSGADARAIHWLACVSELVTLSLGDIPKPASEVSDWLGKFAKIAAPKPGETTPATK